jgi:hypothetical protein
MWRNKQASWRCSTSAVISLVRTLLQATRSQAERQGQRLGPLITNVNPQVFQRPTFSLFLRLLDNYKR